MYALEVTDVDTRFVTRDHFIASIEMQLSGEPLATAMGRDTTLYVRDYVCQDAVCSPDAYPDGMQLTDAGTPATRIDLAGFSSAVESYEYSKQPMNNVSFESGAGTSLLFGPVLNPEQQTGTAALKLAQDWLTQMAAESNATRRVTVDAEHPLGWPGFWPTLQPFDSWDPAIKPAKTGGGCSLTSDDNHGPHSGLISNDYECDYTSLNLSDRATHVSMRIGPGASGWAAWKQALWALNYLQVMHDVKESPVDHVREALLSDVGMPGNTTGPGFSPGTYLGSSNIEGFQAGALLQSLDNQAAQWLFELNTPDGRNLGGFASLNEALAYAPDSPLRWFPASIAVQETADDSGFPRPERYTIMQSDSQLLDLAGLLGAYATVYALTDVDNPQVGGSQAARAYFDADPFPMQPERPNGQPSMHDRSLAMLRVVTANIARMHVEPQDTSFRDGASIGDNPDEISRGAVLSSDVAAYTLLALRTAHRALGAQLTLYSNTTPDTAAIPSPLDRYAWSDEHNHSQELDELIDALSRTFYDKLTTEDGRAFGGWHYSRGAALDKGDRLDAHTAAIRGLLSAYLASGSIRYRDRAERVFQRLEATFYDPRARIYRPVEGDHSTEVSFTPRRFGLLQAALRDCYELIALLPGKQTLRSLIETHLARLNKLVLNGWDDRNQDQRVNWPDECAHLGKGPDGEPLGLGGLQMGERTLTGETGALPPDPNADGSRVPVADRDHDCVPEISAVGLPAALANSITFRLMPLTSDMKDTSP